MIDVSVESSRPSPVAVVSTGQQLALAHFGCMVLGKLKGSVPPDIKAKWDCKFGNRKAWSCTTDATARLARALHQAAVDAGYPALTLWDTMRKGSDYWRPGNLLSKVADALLSSNPPIRVTFLKMDDLCPLASLLKEFRDNCQMTFGEYAERYSQYLRQTDGLLQRATERIMIELSLPSLPAFYCTDSHVPDYLPPDQILRVPYRDRNWLSELRTVGCHRLILAEEIIRFLLQSGAAQVKLYEIDPTLGRVFRREFSK
jgi:hypothetical protein